MHFAKVAIIGVGLIGGSVGLALKKFGLADVIVGSGRQKPSLDEALRVGAVDAVTLDHGEAVSNANLIVVAVPVRAMPSVFEQIAPRLMRDALVTDVGSSKETVVSAAESRLGEKVRFVGSHPMAGSEKKGVAYALPDLFVGRTVAVTPTERTNEEAVDMISSLWHSVGATTVRLSPKEHDAIVAVTSHLPHVSAAALSITLGNLGHDQASSLIGDGFLDTTRIASSDPEMWRDICLENAPALLQALEKAQSEIEKLYKLVSARDAVGVFEFFRASKAARDILIHKETGR